MRAELQARKLWKTMNENIVPPTNEKALEAYNKKNELTTSMIYHAVLDDVLLMISSSTLAKEAWDKLKKIYLGTNFSRRYTILQKLLQSRQGEDENVAIYLNKIIDLKIQFVAYGCNLINDEFMVFIIIQSLSSKFINFVIVMETRIDETRIDDEKEFFSLENLSRHLLKHEETLNNKVLISPKDNNVALRATKTPFKNKFNHQKRSYPSSSIGFEKRGNGYNNNRNNENYNNNKNNSSSRNNDNNKFKQRYGKDKANNPYPKENFDGKYNYYGI